jgi:hypothetical protein
MRNGDGQTCFQYQIGPLVTLITKLIIVLLTFSSDLFSLRVSNIVPIPHPPLFLPFPHGPTNRHSGSTAEAN